MNMKINRLGPSQNPQLQTISSFDGVGHDKQRERVNARSRIPQRMSSPTTFARNRTPKKVAENNSHEASRPKSASTRPPPTHPAQLQQGVRQMSQIRPTKERPATERPSNLSKQAPPPFRPPTPVIKVPCSPVSTGMSGQEDRHILASVFLDSDHHSEPKGKDLNFSSNKKVKLLQAQWQKNIAKFESIKRQLHEKQVYLIELFAKLRHNHKELSDMGQSMSLPASGDLHFMNVGQLAPKQLLQMCAGAEDSEIANINPSSDLDVLRKIPNQIVATCEQTLKCRKEIIDWFEDVIAKKAITKNTLSRKIQKFKTENEGLQRSLDKHKEDYLRFLNDTVNGFKKGRKNALEIALRCENVSYTVTELNAINEDLQNKLIETQDQVILAENKALELENQLKDEKQKKREQTARAEQITEIFEQTKSKTLSLEKMVCQLSEENRDMKSTYDKNLKEVNDYIDTNAKLLDEITADRRKLLTEKQDLEKQLMELSKNFEETLRSTKHESNSTVAKLIETEKKYQEALDEKNNLAHKIESMCAQVLESELRFKDASKTLAEMESTSRELEMLKGQLENTKEEILEFKKIAVRQKEVIYDLQQKWKNSLNSMEFLKSELNTKENSILELEKHRTVLEERLLESQLKSKSYAEELADLKNQITPLQEVFGEFKTLGEIHEMIKHQTVQVTETKQQNNTLTETLMKKDIELQQRAETITEQGQLLEEQEAAMKMLRDKNEEQTHIIKLLRKNLEDRTQADIEINRQIDEKNTEIDSLISNVEKRKQQISQLERIILTLENQIVELSVENKTAHKADSSLKRRLGDYESYYVTKANKALSSTANFDELFNIMEYVLTNPSEDQGGLTPNQELGTQHVTHKNHPKNNVYMHQLQNNVPSKIEARKYTQYKKVFSKDKHKGDGVGGNEVFKSVVSSESVTLPKADGSSTTNKGNKNTFLCRPHNTTNVHYCLTPNHDKDEKKIRMFKLAGHKLQ